MDASPDKAVNIKTVARVRPYFDGTNRQSSLTIDSKSSSITVKLPNKEHIVHLDNAFDENSTQDTIYKSVAQSIVVGFLGGTNGTIIAYGQTGSGKTYTMNGLERDTKADSPTRGIIVRAVENIFENLNATVEKNPCSFKYSLKCAFIQVYKDKPFDLLQSGDVEVTIQGSSEQVSFRGAKEFDVKSVEECIKYLQNGWKKRKTAGTSMNVESSRSHAIFMLTLFTETIEGTLINNRTSRLNFGDLAGSERQKDTNNTGERFKEAGSINQDLLFLSQIIQTLGTAKKGEYINYRNCLLTHLLRDSLGGNARTAIIVTIHSNCDFVRDTVSTLTFAENCKKVKNTAKVNEAVSTKNVGLWKAEIQQLLNEKQQIKEEKEQREKLLQNKNKMLEEKIVEMQIKHEQEIKKLQEMVEFQNRTINSTLCSVEFPRDAHGYMSFTFSNYSNLTKLNDLSKTLNKSDETIRLSRENDPIIKEIIKSLLDQVECLQGGNDIESETSSSVENDSNGYHQNFILPQDQSLAFCSLKNLTGPSFMDNLSFEQSDGDIGDETAHFSVYVENDRRNESSVVVRDDFYDDKSKHDSSDSNNDANSDNTFTADSDEGHASKNFLDKSNLASFDVSESDDRHNSLSPENEFESNDSSPKIIDSNVSQDHDSGTKDNFGKLLASYDLNSGYEIDESAATVASNNSLYISNQNHSLSGVSEGGNQEQNIADNSYRDNSCIGDFGIDKSSVESTFSFSLFVKSPEQSNYAAQNSAHFGAPERIYQEQSSDSFNGSAFSSQVKKSPEQSDNAAQNSAHFGASERVDQDQNIANNSYRDNTFNGYFGNETLNESTLSSSQVEKSPEQGYNAARFGVSELRDQEQKSSNDSIIDHDFGSGDSFNGSTLSSQVEKSPAVQNSLNGTIILGDTPLSTFGMNRTIVISPSPLEPVPKRRRITRNQKTLSFQQNNPNESFNNETDVEESFVSEYDNLDDSDYRPENEKKFIAEQRYFRGSSSKFGGEIPSQALESPFNRSDRCYCTKSLCQTRKCGCKKAGRPCNIYCHRKEDCFNDCLNH